MIIYPLRTRLLAILLCVCPFVSCGFSQSSSPAPSGGILSANSDGEISDQTQTVSLFGEDTWVCDGISQTRPDENVESIDSLILQNGLDNTNLSGLLRCSLPAGTEAENIARATLTLTPLEEPQGNPPTLVASAVIPSWTRLDSTWNLIHQENPQDLSAPGVLLPDGRTQLDVTSILKAWYRGDYNNMGFLINNTQSGSRAVFYSPYRADPENGPCLTIKYTPSAHQINRYDFVSTEDGNCLSFALRDYTAILEEDLGITQKAVSEAYHAGGNEALLLYLEPLWRDYLKSHQEALGVTAIREIPSFDAPFDAQTEYRIAFRVGGVASPDGEVVYDFHFLAQLPDGSWAEKLGASPSRKVPGSNLTLNPGLFPWNEANTIGSSKHDGFYASRTLYYAVQKKEVAFTNHGK